MTKRKADSDPPSEPKPKKPTASNQENIKSESPAAKAYRSRRAAKLAQIPPDASVASPETYDVYAVSSTLPSPPRSTRQSPPAVPRFDNKILGQDEDARNDTQSAESSPTISGLMLDESTLLDILCFHCDDNLATDAFVAIMQHAAAAAKPGDEFGTLFLKRFISELADTPINPDWLTEIIGLLQQNLDSLCDRAKCQIQSLGKLPLPQRERLEPPVDEIEDDDTEASLGTLLSHIGEASEKTETKTIDKSANDQEDVGDRKHTVAPAKSKKSKRKVKDSQQSSQAASKQFSTTQAWAASDNNTLDSKPNSAPSDLQPSEAHINTPYDLFVQSAAAANCFAKAQDRKTVKAYNKRARRLWSRIEVEQQAAWVKLFHARPDDVPLVIKGEGLLWSQDLVAKLLPDDCKPKPEHIG
jgi:hypothetical protein